MNILDALEELKLGKVVSAICREKEPPNISYTYYCFMAFTEPVREREVRQVFPDQIVTSYEDLKKAEYRVITSVSIEDLGDIQYQSMTYDEWFKLNRGRHGEVEVPQ